MQEFCGRLTDILSVLNRGNAELIITGDFNLDLLKYDQHLPTGEYLDLMIANRFLPSIVRPTRIKHQSATLIDHTWIRFDCKLVFSAIINTEIAGQFGYTDHLPTITILQTNLEKKVQPKTIKKYFFTH